MVGESETSSLGINESYIQSDIANIISKMYSPHFDMQENALSDGRCSIVEEKISSNREIHWKENERTNKRFGYYFETETRNHLRTVLDSSSSGSVSLPSVRHKPSRCGTYACRCCRRKISNRLHNKRVSSACGHCRVCTKALSPPANVRGNCVLNDSEDFTREDELLIGKSEQINPENNACTVLNEIHKDKQENIHDNVVAMGNSWDREKPLIEEPEVTLIKNQSKPLLSRVFSSLIGICSFDKSKPTTGIDGYHNKVDITSQTQAQEVRINYHQLELGVEPSKLFVQKQQSYKSMRSVKQYKSEGCRNLAENSDEINSVCSDECKLDLHHQELISSGEDKSKLPIVNCKQSSKKCQEMLQESLGDVKQPPVCMPEHGESILGNGAEINEEYTKAQLKTDSKIPDEIAHSKTPERANTYRLDLGDQQLLRTTATDLLADRNDERAAQFWARVFGHGHLVLAFITAFALQLFRFVLQGLVRPLVWGSLQLACDHCLKPFLAVLFDGLLQPVLRLLQNVACSTRDVARPLAEAVGFFVGELARLFSACRLVEVHAADRKAP